MVINAVPGSDRLLLHWHERGLGRLDSNARKFLGELFSHLPPEKASSIIGIWADELIFTLEPTHDQGGSMWPSPVVIRGRTSFDMRDEMLPLVSARTIGSEGEVRTRLSQVREALLTIN